MVNQSCGDRIGVTESPGAADWAIRQLANLDRSATGPMTEVSIQAWSSVWRLQTDQGPVLIKQSAAPRQHEGQILAFCAQAAPDHVDPPLASDPDSGRMLVIDRGPTLYDADRTLRGLDLERVLALVNDYARFQQATIGQDHQAAAAGIPSWHPAAAAQEAERAAMWLHHLPARDPRRIGPDQLGQIQQCLTEIDHAGKAVADSPVPTCLEHGDVWPGNVIATADNRRFRYIDLGDAAWSHPFLSMIMLVVECRHHWSVPEVPGQLNIDHPVLDQIFDTYLRSWSDYAPLNELRRTLHRALRIAPLRRSQAWLDNLAHADQRALTKLGQMPWTWLEDLTLPVKARDAR